MTLAFRLTCTLCCIDLVAYALRMPNVHATATRLCLNCMLYRICWWLPVTLPVTVIQR